MIYGYSERECIYKRFFWRENGQFYVYQSSVPDAIHPDEEDCRDDATRYDISHMTQCFKSVGQDLLVETVYQIDFRGIMSHARLETYNKQQITERQYWYNALKERVEQ